MKSLTYIFIQKGGLAMFSVVLAVTFISTFLSDLISNMGYLGVGTGVSPSLFVIGFIGILLFSPLALFVQGYFTYEVLQSGVEGRDLTSPFSLNLVRDNIKKATKYVLLSIIHSCLITFALIIPILLIILVTIFILILLFSSQAAISIGFGIALLALLAITTLILLISIQSYQYTWIYRLVKTNTFMEGLKLGQVFNSFFTNFKKLFLLSLKLFLISLTITIIPVTIYAAYGILVNTAVLRGDEISHFLIISLSFFTVLLLSFASTVSFFTVNRIAGIELKKILD